MVVYLRQLAKRNNRVIICSLDRLSKPDPDLFYKLVLLSAELTHQLRSLVSANRASQFCWCESSTEHKTGQLPPEVAPH